MPRFVTLLLLAFCCGCENVFFKQPQPSDEANLPEIPSSLIGKYFQTGEKTDCDSALLSVSSKQFTYTKVKWKKIPLSDTATIRKAKLNLQKKSGKDGNFISNYSSFETKDTLFFREEDVSKMILGPRNSFRPFGKNFILNHTDTIPADSSWYVIVIRPQTNGISVCMPFIGEHILPADSVEMEDIPADSTFAFYSSCSPFEEEDGFWGFQFYRTDPTPAELQCLFDKGLFTEFARFEKIK